jgi:hypothetical protein
VFTLGNEADLDGDCLSLPVGHNTRANFGTTLTTAVARCLFPTVKSNEAFGQMVRWWMQNRQDGANHRRHRTSLTRRRCAVPLGNEMIDQNQIPQWLVRGPFPRFMVLFTRIALSIYILLGTAMLAFVIWGLFCCSTEVIEGLDPAAPFLSKLHPIGFLAFCIALGIFGISNSFRRKGQNSQPSPGAYSSKAADGLTGNAQEWRSVREKNENDNR